MNVTTVKQFYSELLVCVWGCVRVNILPSRLSLERTYVIGYDQINLSPADIPVISSVTNQLTYDKLLKLFRKALQNFPASLAARRVYGAGFKESKDLGIR